jgi:hypothetical protein
VGLRAVCNARACDARRAARVLLSGRGPGQGGPTAENPHELSPLGFKWLAGLLAHAKGAPSPGPSRHFPAGRST